MKYFHQGKARAQVALDIEEFENQHACEADAFSALGGWTVGWTEPGKGDRTVALVCGDRIKFARVC